MKPIPALGALAAAIALLAPATAGAAPITSVFDGAVNCTTSPSGPTAGQRFCQGTTAPYFVSTVPSFDGTPIDVSVTLPPAPATGDDGNFPVVGVYHGYGSSKILPTDATNAQRWLAQGYAVYSITDRGFWGSCGVLVPNPKPAACANGYIHLMSARYEVRDAQYLLGLLADENVINPQQIGAVGGSYGGGMAMILGALKDRVMLTDGTLAPWTSPGGKALRIGATAPEFGWSDLAQSLQPNGSTLDYAADNPYSGPNGDRRFGSQKQNWNAQLYGGGAQTGYYAAPGTDPSADITSWKGLNDTGGPYDGAPLATAQLAELKLHGAATIDATRAPAPAFISNGWNDDLFPVTEAVRYYNRIRDLHPTAPISMFHVNYGHPNRGGTPPVDDVRAVYTAEVLWFNRYVKGTGIQPANPNGGVAIATSACNGTAVIPGKTYQATNWASLSPGEIRLGAAAAQTVAPGTAPTTTFEGSGVTVCTDGPATATAGAATVQSDPAPAGGFTIAGATTVVADLTVGGANDQLIGRLYDVDPATGNQKLIGRSIYRPTGVGSTSRQVFQLHPQAYEIAAGHRVKVELLSADAPYVRTATGQGPITVANVEVRVPTLDRPGAAGGLVVTPAAKVLPAGYRIARDLVPVEVPAPGPVPMVPPIITPIANLPVTIPGPLDTVSLDAVRTAIRATPTGRSVNKARSKVTLTDSFPAAGKATYRLSIDVRKGKGKSRRTVRVTLGTATKTVTAAGKTKVTFTVKKSNRSRIKSKGSTRLILSTTFTTAVKGDELSSVRKFTVKR